MADDPVDVVAVADLTGEDKPNIGATPRFLEKAYEPLTKTFGLEGEREKKRGQIALILVWLLVGMVAASFIFTYLRSFTGTDLGGIAVKDIKEILTVIFSPIVALVGAVTGFYYGGKSERVTANAQGDERP